MNHFGLKIITDVNMTVPAQDWSRVRSPSRAVRRLRRGFPQNIRHWRKPSPNAFCIGDKWIMHPSMAEKLAIEIEGGRV